MWEGLMQGRGLALHGPTQSCFRVAGAPYSLSGNGLKAARYASALRYSHAYETSLVSHSPVNLESSQYL